MAYAWALDHDDPDEFPTQRLTPRRTTALGIAASLVTIAGGGFSLACLSMNSAIAAMASAGVALVTTSIPSGMGPSASIRRNRFCSRLCPSSSAR